MDRANVAAYFHARMAVDDRFGYTQGGGRWGTGPLEYWEADGVTGQFLIGDRDCSSSVIDCWSEALRGSRFEGALDGATYTGNMRWTFVNSGLFEWHPMGDGYVAQKGDVYLNETYHTAMCQNAVPDTLSEASISENGTIYGQVGDQTGWEFVTDRPYYDFPWDGILAYNHLADEDPEPEPEERPMNDAGLYYRAHVSDYGWLPWVRDGLTAGTVGEARKLEALQIRPPEGWEISARAHIENKGWVEYPIIRGENGVVIGTVGEHLQIESLLLGVAKRPDGDDSMLWFQVHQQDTGWKAKTLEGYASGSDGLNMRLEAVRMWIE